MREFCYQFREITSVDVSPDNRYVCSASMDNTLRIFGLDSGKLIRTLTFSVALGSGNLAFKGCRFDPSGGGDLFSMQTTMRGNAYVTRWNGKANFEAIRTTVVHAKPATAFDIKGDGKALAVGTADGCVIGISSGGEVSCMRQEHKMPVTSITFGTGNSTNEMLASSADFRCSFTPYSGGSGIMAILFSVVMLALVCGYLALYLT